MSKELLYVKLHNAEPHFTVCVGDVIFGRRVCSPGWWNKELAHVDYFYYNPSSDTGLWCYNGFLTKRIIKEFGDIEPLRYAAKTGKYFFAGAKNERISDYNEKYLGPKDYLFSFIATAENKGLYKPWIRDDDVTSHIRDAELIIEKQNLRSLWAC